MDARGVVEALLANALGEAALGRCRRIALEVAADRVRIAAHKVEEGLLAGRRQAAAAEARSRQEADFAAGGER